MSAAIYVNGRIIATAAKILPDSTQQKFLITGSSFNCGAAYFNGTIDEVRIYSRALTAEIQKQYAEGLVRHTLAEK